MISIMLYPIPGFPYYGITRDGRVWSERKKKFMKFARGSHTGYYHTDFKIGNRMRSFDIHRMVALTFLGVPPTPNSVVNHKNGIKTDNRVENLEWCSQKDNNRHAVHIGLVGRSKETGRMISVRTNTNL